MYLIDMLEKQSAWKDWMMGYIDIRKIAINREELVSVVFCYDDNSNVILITSNPKEAVKRLSEFRYKE